MATKATLGRPGKRRMLPSQFGLRPAKPDPNGNRRQRRAAKATKTESRPAIK